MVELCIVVDVIVVFDISVVVVVYDISLVVVVVLLFVYTPFFLA
jgi:hypothetical protein